MTTQLIGLKRAKEMRELGFPQTSELFWWLYADKMTSVSAKAVVHGTLTDEKGWSAYSIEEMKQWMPDGHEDQRLELETDKANNYADVLIDLVKAGTIKF